MKTLYVNARVLFPDGTARPGAVGVDGDRFAYVGPEPADRAGWDAVRDLDGGWFLPGLVNAHGHSAMTLLRGRGAGLPLQRWLEEAIFPVEAKLTPEDIEAGVTWACVEMLRCGTTCVADMYDFPEAGARAFARCGMKANVCRVGLAFPGTTDVPPGRLAECISFTRDFNDPAGLVAADFCLHSEYLTQEAFVRALAEANADIRRPVHVHVSETEREHAECLARHGKTPVAYLADCGMFDHGGYVAHGVWCTDDDFRILRDRGGTLVHNPTSNLKLGSGVARIPAALKAGVNVALGTDGTASNDNLNMFEEMHLMALLHKGIARDPSVVTPREVLAAATANGARALVRPDTGSIEVGKKADFCVVDASAPHLKPAFDPATLLVTSAQGSDVVLTAVDGRVLYDHGVFTTIDVEKAEADLGIVCKRLYGGSAA